MQKLMIGLVGEMACGKGVATKLVKEWYPKTPSFRFSDALREFYADISSHKRNLKKMMDVDAMVVRAFGDKLLAQHDGMGDFALWLIAEFFPKHKGEWPIEASTSDLQSISTAVRRCFGGDILERAIIARVNASDSESPIIILDGIRRQRDIATLVKDPSVSFGLLYIEVDAETRYRRHNVRAEKFGDAELTFEQFLELGSVEAEREIVRLRSLSNAIIDNSGEPAHLEGALRMLIEGWLVHGTENRR